MDLSDYNDHDYKLGRICMRRLHVLNTEGIVMKRIWERVELPNILWLRWVNCPHSSLPSLIPMKKLKNLKFLRLSGSELNTLWERESDSQVRNLLC